MLVAHGRGAGSLLSLRQHCSAQHANPIQSTSFDIIRRGNIIKSTSLHPPSPLVTFVSTVHTNLKANVVEIQALRKWQLEFDSEDLPSDKVCYPILKI